MHKLTGVKQEPSCIIWDKLPLQVGSLEANYKWIFKKFKKDI